jgi:hypothetical protein
MQAKPDIISRRATLFNNGQQGGKQETSSKNFPASAVEVTVRKLLPPMKVPAQATGVRIQRRR